MRKFRYLAALVLALAIFDGSGMAAALAAPANAPAPNPTRIFLNDCGHTLAGQMLYYWRTHGRDQSIGCPVSEEIPTQNGGSYQYFNKFRLEYHPENAGTTWEFSFGLIGVEVYNALSPDEKANPAYKKLDPFDNQPNRTYFKETGHAISFGMRDFWNANNGLYNYGLPISEEYPYFNGDKNYSAQDFERARLLYNPDTGIILDDLGKIAAKANKVDTNPVQQAADVPSYGPNTWEHWVDVNLSKFTATFMEGDLPVRTNLTVPGTATHPTPVGTFYIISRVANEHMKGGEIGTEDYYDLYNVLYTQYFTGEGHALHYAWWRSTFGYPGSHGCVNMDLESSYFAWTWLTLGSRVYIHY